MIKIVREALTSNGARERWLSPDTVRRFAIMVSSIVVILATVVLAPIMLLALGKIFRVDWLHLSAIGQSYNGISALLSAGALVSLVVTTRVQLRQMHTMQESLTFEMQFNLLKLPLNDAELAAVTNIGVEYQDDQLTKKQHLYFTIWFRYLAFLFITKNISTNSLALLIESEFANNRSAVAYWSQVRRFWLTGSPGLGRQFFEIVDGEMKEAG